MPGQVVDIKLPEPRIRIFRATLEIYKQGKQHANTADFEGNLKRQKLLQQWLPAPLRIGNIKESC